MYHTPVVCHITDILPGKKTRYVHTQPIEKRTQILNLLLRAWFVTHDKHVRAFSRYITRNMWSLLLLFSHLNLPRIYDRLPRAPTTRMVVRVGTFRRAKKMNGMDNNQKEQNINKAVVRSV